MIKRIEAQMQGGFLFKQYETFKRLTGRKKKENAFANIFLLIKNNQNK